MAGHAVRMGDKIMVKSIIDWKPLGKKAIEKSRNRWIDDQLKWFPKWVSPSSSV